ncbi:MAG: insulinase family protein [Clostridia bacterium]|nr:insulinase family protein [Clostridia bacterium]
MAEIKCYADLAPNKAYELLYEETLDDIKSAGIVLRHKKSGARVCILPNDDENKLFCAAFRTPPEDSTGVCHIIEHTVLCGSKNFPSRDPFMQLAKGSLNTFLNAMTYPDKTLYPVASCNDKDFKNLMNVYMDAVFYPNIYKYRQIFMQEGWHYELDNPGDELKINGVVYSEMKGAMSSPDRTVWDELNTVLLPDTTYGVNSGGDPDVIPDLTYEYYLNFHRSHYHPSNAYIFLYGNCDMNERLAWMDENYLSAFDAIEPHSEVKTQPRFGSKEPRRAVSHYSVGMNDETEGKAFLAYAALGGSNLDVLDCRAWNILSSVLLNDDGAPVKKALIDAGIGEDIYGGYDSHMIEDSFSVIAKNAKAEDLDRFYAIILDTLRAEVEKGINEKALLAAINIREFHFREADYGGYPRGLDVASDMLQSWLYDEDGAFTYMHVLDDFAELKRRIGTGYYEDLVRRVILESDHAVLMTLLPERGMVDRKDRELREKLAAYKASLSEAEIAAIVADTKALREYQSHEPTEEELNCIPSLKREDISKDTIPFYNEERTVGGVKTIFHPVETNGITYAALYFDIGRLPHRYVPYLGLLGHILGRVDTDRHTYDELTIDIRLNLGGLSFWPATPRKFGTLDDYRPMFAIHTKALAEKIPFALETALEIARGTKFTDTARLKTIIAELKSDRQRAIMSNGNSVAAARARSYYSKYDCYDQALNGLDFYFFVKDLADNFDDRKAALSENLAKVAAAVFDPKNVVLSLAADEAGIEAIDKNLPALIEGLRAIPREPLGEAEEYVPVKKNEGILIPSQVQYVARVGNLAFDGLSYNGALQVVRTAVNTDWLYQQIRVKGGAYGCGCGFGGASGNVTFSSYRDPKLTETDEVYKGTGNWVKNAKFDEAELTKYIIGTFSGYERPMSPAGKASRSFDAWLTGRTYEDVVKEREEMLSITAEQFHAASGIFDKICAQGYLCAVGSEKTLRDHADMFDNLVNI